MASGNKNYDIAKQTSLESMNTGIGGSSDSGSATLWGKINAVAASLAAHVAAWTTARAAKIDTIDTNASTAATKASAAATDAAANKTTLATVNTNASTAATKATAAASDAASIKTTVGTINTNAARLTATRAGYIDRLANSTYGLSALKTAIDGIGGVSLTGIGKTLYSSSTAITGIGANSYKCLAKFIAPVEGWYTITVSESGGSYGLNVYTVRHPKGPMYGMYDSDTSNYFYDPSAYMLFVDNVVKSIYDNSTVGASAMYNSSDTIYYAYISEDTAPVLMALHRFMTVSKSSNGTYHMFCYAGEPIVLMGCCASSSSCKMGSISITYGSN